VALLEKRRFLYNHSGDFPQVILIVPSHVPNTKNFKKHIFYLTELVAKEIQVIHIFLYRPEFQKEISLKRFLSRVFFYFSII
jgi:hypothetical protein